MYTRLNHTEPPPFEISQLIHLVTLLLQVYAVFAVPLWVMIVLLLNELAS